MRREAWIVPFEAGELCVKGYPAETDGKASKENSEKENAEPVTFLLCTTGEPERLLLKRWASQDGLSDSRKSRSGASALRQLPSRAADRTADRTAGHVEQIEITLADHDGNTVAHRDLPVTVSVSGPGVLLGLENGDLADNTPYSEPVRSTLDGRLIAYVRRTGEGDILVNVSAGDCAEASIRLPED